MEFFVYVIENKTNGKFYVGRTKNLTERFYTHKLFLRNNTHHCRYLQNAWNKHGEENFEIKVIEVFSTEEESAVKEQWFLDHYKDVLYNKSLSAYGGGDNISMHPNKDQIIKNIGNGMKIWYSSKSPEEVHRIRALFGKRNGMFGRTHTSEARKIIREKLKQYYLANPSPRTGKTLKELFGEEKANEISQKLSAFAKTRTSTKNPFYGKHHTEETKEKLRQIHSGRKPVNQRPVLIDGSEYPSVREASRVLNVVPGTIIHRIKSKNQKYAQYFYKV